MFGFGSTELLIILVLALVIFGAGKLPTIGGALGRGLRDFRKAARDANTIDITPEPLKEESAADRSTPEA